MNTRIRVILMISLTLLSVGMSFQEIVINQVHLVPVISRVQTTVVSVLPPVVTVSTPKPQSVCFLPIEGRDNDYSSDPRIAYVMMSGSVAAHYVPGPECAFLFSS